MGRFITSLGLCLLLTHCAGPPAASGPAPSFQPLNPTPPVAVLQQDTSTPEQVAAPTSSGDPAAKPPSRTLPLGSTITFEGVAFDSRNYRLAVIDQSAGPGTTHQNATDAGRSIQGLAAVNGGFFTPEGEPLGLVVSSGNARGHWNTTSSLASGVFYQNRAGSLNIARRDTLTREQAMTMSELLQAGPLLVENRQPVAGLSNRKSRRRTILLWDGHHRWWIGQSSHGSLNQLATFLCDQPPVGWKVQQALNLDGGSSCDLWISKAIHGGPFTRKPFFSKPARNYLVLVPR